MRAGTVLNRVWTAIRAVGIALIASAALGFAWWSGLSLTMQFDELPTRIAAAMTPPSPSPRSDAGHGLEIIHTYPPPSVCCDDFNDGMSMVLLGVFLSGIPAAVVALTLWLRVRRAETPTLASGWHFVVLGGAILQVANLVLSLCLVGVAVTLGAAGEIVTDSSGIYLLATLAASAVALPAWRLIAGAVLSKDALTISAA
jgi:hypothetical protein